MSKRFSLGNGDALKDPTQKRQINREVFSIVARRYQWITRILSLGRDQSWKRQLIMALPNLANPLCLDLACGTGDLCRLIAQHYLGSDVVAIDLCPEMLQLASQRPTPPHLHYVLADMLSLPIPDHSIDIVTGGYALRNAPDLNKLLAILFQKMKPGAIALFLDFSRPAKPLKAKIQAKIINFWTRLWGIIFHGNADVYGYIAQSLALFPNTEELENLVIKNGFHKFSQQQYLGGFTARIQFYKPSIEISK